MKVYAEYFERDGMIFRTNTLIQLGTGWELIGNAVLANPGSAKPKTTASISALNSISEFYKNYRVTSPFTEENWYEFSPDSTMRFLEKIFNGWYFNKSRKLNGIIQLFNTFNIKNQKIHQAIEQAKTSSEMMFSKDVYNHFHDKPTYFGFGKDVIQNEMLKNVAKNIFDNSSEKIRSIYMPQFSENSFYHPMYVNQAYKQDHFIEYKKKILQRLINKSYWETKW